jgi:hypothetical protein
MYRCTILTVLAFLAMGYVTPSSVQAQFRAYCGPASAFRSPSGLGASAPALTPSLGPRLTPEFGRITLESSLPLVPSVQPDTNTDSDASRTLTERGPAIPPPPPTTVADSVPPMAASDESNDDNQIPANNDWLSVSEPDAETVGHTWQGWCWLGVGLAAFVLSRAVSASS